LGVTIAFAAIAFAAIAFAAMVTGHAGELN
jgi:hypothetical protein